MDEGQANVFWRDRMISGSLSPYVYFVTALLQGVLDFNQVFSPVKFLKYIQIVSKHGFTTSWRFDRNTHVRKKMFRNDGSNPMP
jgi:hypothetical protein